MNKELKAKCNLSNFDRLAQKNNYKIFNSKLVDYKPYNLNIWAVRSNNLQGGYFDDVLCIFYTDENKDYVFKTYTVTTDPSNLSLIQMKNKYGVAIIKPGQYLGSHKLGLHRGSYKALVQNKPISVIRDFNKDDILDVNHPPYRERREYTKDNTTFIDYYDDAGKLIFRENVGMFGINIHRASQHSIVREVGRYSEGCIVFQDPVKYNEFINIIEKSIPYYNNSFSLTLITEAELTKVMGVEYLKNIKISKEFLKRMI